MEASVLREVATSIAGYFRDFLESDFKRIQAPSRKIVLQSESGFRAGMRLKPYETLDRDFWRLLQQPSGEYLGLKIAPRKYTRNLSVIIQKVIAEQITALEESQLASVRMALKDHIDRTYSEAAADAEEWIEGAIDKLCEELSVRVVKPLIAKLDGPLQRQAYSVIDSLYSVETDMVSLVGAELAGSLPEVLSKHLAIRNDDSVAEVLESFLTLIGTQDALNRFFERFVAADAFLEFRDLETFISVTESASLYLYLGSLKFRGISYPLFFLPVEVSKVEDGSGFELTLINQLFANRAAIDFALQELAAAKTRSWASVINDRIIYLQSQQSIFEMVRGLFAQVANAFDFAGQTSFGSSSPDVTNPEVSISSSLYLCAFEKGAEALVNDYEELIKLAKEGGTEIVNLFEGIVRNILEDNPNSIRSAIESEWDALSIVDRMVFDSPIPLNEEQRKILMAVRHPEGRIIVVEGPPGTGKSHTITAIAADCAFNQRSCLVLSDKAEALEVVQSKLSEAMSRVRHDPNFPNPLLRLGRQDANFKKLVANQTVNQVAAFAKAMNANAHHIEQERAETTIYLKESIEKSVDILGSIRIGKIQELHLLEDRIRNVSQDLVSEVQRIEDTIAVEKQLQPIVELLDELVLFFSTLPQDRIADLTWLRNRASIDLAVGTFVDGNAQAVHSMKSFSRLDADQLKLLSDVLLQYRQLRMPIFGYLFKGAAVRALENQVNALPAQRPLLLKVEVANLEAVVVATHALRRELEKHSQAEYLSAAYEQAVSRPSRSRVANGLLSILNALAKYESLLDKSLRAGAESFGNVIRFIHEWSALRAQFDAAPEFDYVGLKDKLDRINTLRMNAHVDSRLVGFMEHHRADAKTMAQLISRRQKFPEEKFEAVRTSFPVIIAGIREFGEFMPLVPQLFDVVVIDEASQVSVAQALPAILRAKKVVVLGDSKQFANVKSANASIATNEKYRSNLVNFFERTVTKDAATLQRLTMFDVKKSVLEFCGLASSYTIMLRKHFRSYPELIGYSSKTFYDGQLQAIKIRGVPIEDVVRFDLVSLEGHPVSRSTNAAEASFIVDRLVEFLDLDDPPTVGVITPFREQHTFLTKQLFSHARANDFEDRLRLKVMTFDSCQGEERKVIFYSMVASPGNDALAYVFPAAVGFDSAAVEEKLKVQRLNVGFSRAQECIWVVHSMPIEMFKGSIAQALNYYAQVSKAKTGSAEQTDQSSPMEAKVLHWLRSTSFVQSQHENIEILPQFPIGDYLKQLDPTYQHPAYRVDFLVTCRTPKNVVQIIIEYDGWEFHFKQGGNVHLGNHVRYQNDSDIERQLTLESYGYRFIRINRFNLGKDPVATLDERLCKIVETATGEQRSKFVERLRDQAQGMVTKEMRQCGRCEAIKPLEAFFDKALKGGNGNYGRLCMECKNKSTGETTSRTSRAEWRGRRRW